MTSLDLAIAAYWRAPDAEALLESFAAADTGDWRPETVLTVPVFLAHLLDARPELGGGLVARVRGGDPVKVEVVAQALNYCNLAERARLMERLVGEAAAAAMDPAGADFTALVPTHPVHVDMLWASFFATGVTGYLDQVVALLEGWLPDSQLQSLLTRARDEDEARPRAMAGLLAKAALATLAAHGGDCPPVVEVLSRRAALADGLGAAMAARLLAGLQS